MTALDGYPMAQQGRGGVALSISAVSSFVGSMIAIGGIILFAPVLAQWSLAFGPAEYFALMIFGHRLPWQHDGGKSAEVVSRRVNRFGAGDGGR